jgi:hypothetical protein
MIHVARENRPWIVIVEPDADAFASRPCHGVRGVPTKNSIGLLQGCPVAAAAGAAAVTMTRLVCRTAACSRRSAVHARSRADDSPRRMRVDEAFFAAALVGELRTALRRVTFVAMMEAADLRSGGDSPD